LRYVHVPIGYDGITKPLALQIVAAARLSPEPIFVHCHHGGRSRKACEILIARGFSRVENLRDGIDGWSLEIDPSTPRY